MTIFNGKQVMLIGLKGDKGDPGIGADVIMSSADDQDLNNYTDTGIYSFDDRATQTNKPNNYSGGFILFVSKQEEQSCTPITQLLMGKDGECWYRSTNDSDGSDRETSWSEWVSTTDKGSSALYVKTSAYCRQSLRQNGNSKESISAEILEQIKEKREKKEPIILYVDFNDNNGMYEVALIPKKHSFNSDQYDYEGYVVNSVNFAEDKKNYIREIEYYKFIITLDTTTLNIYSLYASFLSVKETQTYNIKEGENCILQNINNKDITINLTSSNAKLGVIFADVKDCVVFIDTSNYKPALDSNSQMLQINFFKNNKSYISQDAVKIQITPNSTTQTLSFNKLVWTETYSLTNWAFEGEHNINAWLQVYNSTTPLTDGGQLRFHYRITFNGYAPSVEMIPYYVEEV